MDVLKIKMKGVYFFYYSSSTAKIQMINDENARGRVQIYLDTKYYSSTSLKLFYINTKDSSHHHKDISFNKHVMNNYSRGTTIFFVGVDNILGIRMKNVQTFNNVLCHNRYNTSISSFPQLKGFFNLTDQSFEEFDKFKGFLLCIHSIPKTTEFVCISQEPQDERQNENEEKSGNQSDFQDTGKEQLKRFIYIIDYEKREIVHKMSLPGLYPFERNRGGLDVLNSLFPVHVHNGYLYIKNESYIYIYDVNNLYQLVFEINSVSLIGSLFSPIPICQRRRTNRNNHHQFDKNEKHEKGISIPCSFVCNIKTYGMSILTIEPNSKTFSVSPYNNNLKEYMLKDNMILVPSVNLGFIVSKEYSSEETYLSVFDFISGQFIRSFSQPILPKSSLLLNPPSYDIKFVNLLNEDEKNLLISCVIGDNDWELITFGMETKEELEAYSERMSFLFDSIITIPTTTNEEEEKDDQCCEFIEYMFLPHHHHQQNNNYYSNLFFEQFIEGDEIKKEIFIKLLLGRNIWKNIDPKLFFSFFNYFELCGLNKLKFILAKEYYERICFWINNSITKKFKIEKKEKEEKKKNNSVLEFDEYSSDFYDDFKLKYRDFILLFKTCIQKYEKQKNEVKDDDDDDVEKYIKPPFKSMITLCCYNILKVFHDVIRKKKKKRELVEDSNYSLWFYNEIIQEEKEIWKSFEKYKIRYRIENHPTYYCSVNKEEEEEEEENEGEENDKIFSCDNSYSTFFEFYRNQLRYLYYSKERTNIILECVYEKNKNKIELIKCHKEILIFKSRFFKMMISFPGQESLEESTLGKINIELLKFEQLKLYVEYLYLGSISSSYEFGDLMKLINHAEMFQEHKLAGYCAEKLRVLAEKLQNDNLKEEEEEEETESELQKQLKATGCYLENENIVWNVIVSCFWEFLSKEEIAELINESRVEHGLEELDFTTFLMFPDI